MSNNNYDSEFCGKVPVYNVNLIQDYGYLLVLDDNDLSILQFSENILPLLHIESDELLQLKLPHFLSQDQVDAIQSLSTSNQQSAYPLKLVFYTNNGLLTLRAIVRNIPGFLLMELEEWSEASQSSFEDVYHKLKHCMNHIEAAASIEELATVTAYQLKAVSGFHKVMVYRFDEQWNGTVIAEAKEEDMESYLGLTFPASDIPRQARELYLTNPYRFIPDVNYKPAKLFPVLNPKTRSFINMSTLNLRSVPAVHIEYLKNMGIAASMSVRIIKDGKLWGLIAFHHKTPNKIDYNLCVQLELLSNVVSSRISSLLQNAELNQFQHLLSLQHLLIDKLYSTSDIEKTLADDESILLQLLNVEGLFINLNGRRYKTGNTPTDADMEELVYWLQSKEVVSTYTNTNLAAHLPSANSYAGVASGLIALPLHKADQGDFILGFRPEFVQFVNWGGNPNEAITFADDLQSYHPRNSFKTWQQEVTKTCLPWSIQEKEIAERFRNAFYEFTTRHVYN